MPDLQDIELFKQELNSLGDEPDVLARRGEQIEDVPVPAEGLSDDISELLGGMDDEQTFVTADIESDDAGDDPFAGIDEGDQPFAEVEDAEPDAETPALEEFLESGFGDVEEDPQTGSEESEEGLGVFPPVDESQDEIDLSDIFPDESFESDSEDGEVFESSIDDDLGALADTLVAPDEELPGNESSIELDASQVPEDTDFDASFDADEIETSAEPSMLPADDVAEEPAGALNAVDDVFGIDEETADDPFLPIDIEDQPQDVEEPAADLPDLSAFELPEDPGEEIVGESTETEAADLEAFAFNEPVEGLDTDEENAPVALEDDSTEELATEFEDGLPDTTDFDTIDASADEAIPDSDVSEEDLFSEPQALEEGEEFALPDELDSEDFGGIDSDDFSIPDSDEDFSIPGDTPSDDSLADEDFSFPAELIDGTEEADLGVQEGDDLDESVADDLPQEAEDFALPEDEGFQVPSEAPLDDVFDVSDEELAEGAIADGTDDVFEVSDEEIGETSPPLAGEGIELGAEEDFSLPEEFALEPEEGELDADFSEPVAEDNLEDDFESPPGMESLADMDEEVGEDFEVDEFSLGNLGEAFGVTEDDVSGPVPSEEELNPAMAVSTEELPEEEGLSLAEPDFERMRSTLTSLPINLRIVVEELIGEQMLAGDDLETLLKLLIGGAPAVQIASIAEKITGTEIPVPTQYERRKGEDFEAERGTFAYAFRHNILPIIRIIVMAVIGLGILSFAGYQLGYRPIYAGSLYRQGYTELQEERYPSANDYFERGFDTWRMKKWFFTYAEGYVDKKQYFLAEEKYEQLKDVFHDREGILDYARMESSLRARYEHAEELLKSEILDDDMYDYDALMLLGDNYLEWGDEDPEKYEEARFAYANLMSRYGQRDEILFRMLDYFIRKDEMSEVVDLRDRFQANTKLDVEPKIYAKMAGYLIDKGDLTDTKEILFRAMDVNEFLPEVHYNLAKYFKKIDEYGEEAKALNNTLAYLDMAGPLDRERRWIEIDTNNRLGLSHFRKGEHLDAERRLRKSIDLLEEAVDSRILTSSSAFGNIYSNLADVYYYVSGDFETALELYGKARTSDYEPPALIYKMGYINYRTEELEKAALRFYETAGNYSSDDNLLYSTANTLYKRAEYFAAQGYYNHLLDVLEEQKSSINFLRPDEEEEHRALMFNIMKVYNNLGVTLYQLSRRTGDNDKYSQALVHLTQSNEIFDSLSRNPATLERAETVNLAYLNSRSALFPTSEFVPEIYTEIPKDMDMLFY